MQMKGMQSIAVVVLSGLVLMGCGDGSDLDAVDGEVAVVEDDEVVTEGGLTFSTLSQDGDVVAYVELSRYVGEWFEIATTPSRQQSVCAGTKAIYQAGEDGRIDVTNQCNQGSLEGRLQQVEGFAEVVDTETNAKLEVTFFGFSAPYWVVALDGASGSEPYEWAVVSGPADESLWLLSRTAQLADEDRALIEAHLDERGIDTTRWLNTEQPQAESP